MKARRVIWIVMALVVIAAAIYLRAPQIFGAPHIEEVRRLASPSGAVEAVVQLIDGGATTSRAFCIFVVPKGAKPEDDYRMVTYDGPTLANGDYGVVLDWSSPSVLSVGSTKAKQVFDLRTSLLIQGVTYHVQRKS
jgi:hypothetical protein